MAPGVSILAAAMPSTDKADVPVGKKPSAFAIRSGTSMACPHVAGAGAFCKEEKKTEGQQRSFYMPGPTRQASKRRNSHGAWTEWRV